VAKQTRPNLNWMNKLRSDVPELTPWAIIKNKAQVDTPLWYLSNTNYAEHYTENPYAETSLWRIGAENCYTTRVIIREGGSCNGASIKLQSGHSQNHQSGHDIEKHTTVRYSKSKLQFTQVP